MTPPLVPAKTPGETPAGTLQRAAAKVRELAAEATRGPWESAGHDGNDERGIPPEMCVQGVLDPNARRRHLLVVASGISDDDYEDDSRDYLMVGDAAWIAMLGPQIADPLAALLDAAAVDEDSHNASGATRSAFTDYALALARTLLGSPETPAEAHARAADPVHGWCQCHDGSPPCPHCDALGAPVPEPDGEGTR